MKEIKKRKNKEVNYEFNEGLIAISANIAFGVNDSTERTTKLNEFLFRTFPWKIAKVKNFGWSLCVSELMIVAWWCWHLSDLLLWLQVLILMIDEISWYQRKGRVEIVQGTPYFFIFKLDHWPVLTSGSYKRTNTAEIRK